MAFISDSSALEHEPVSTIILGVLVSAFSILVAFQLRDVITQLIDLANPKHKAYKIMASVFLVSLFLFILVWLSYNFGDRMS